MEVYLLPPLPRRPAVASLVVPPLVVCLATVQVVVVVLSPGNWVVKVVGWKWGWGSSGCRWVTFERVCQKRHTPEREKSTSIDKPLRIHGQAHDMHVGGVQCAQSRGRQTWE